METPYLTHITDDEFMDVYEPAEDSFLLLDALEKELEYLKSKRPLICCEVGSGSGINITALSKYIDNCVFLGTDINPKACIVSKKTADVNSTSLEVLNMDLLSCFRYDLFDVIIFNPPYVVTDEEEINRSKISLAWAGGQDGRLIIDRFLNNIPFLLRSGGVCYLVVIAENKPHEIAKNMAGLNFKTEIVIERKIRGESLTVLKFTRGGDSTNCVLEM